MEAQVRFDLRGRTVGTYDVVANQGAVEARLEAAFDVQPPSLRALRQTLIRPTALLNNDRAALEVVLKNDGNADLDVFTLTLVLPGDQFFSVSSNRMVNAFLVPSSGGSVPNAIDGGIAIDITLPDETSERMGIMTLIGRDLRVGESITVEILSPLIVSTPGEFLLFGRTARGYAAGEFETMLKRNLDGAFGAAENVIRSGRSPDFSADAAPLVAQARELLATDLRGWLDSVGLGEGGVLRGAFITTYTPPDTDAIVPTVAYAALLSGSASITNAQCGKIGLGLGIGIGIIGLIAGAYALPGIIALSIGSSVLIAVIGLVAGTVGLVIAIDSLVNERDWGPWLGRLGTPASPADLIAPAIQFGCELIAGSDDPNDILGPDGYGEARWVPRDAPLPYTIRFENNAETANAPAKDVVITQTLDADLDLRTFRVTSFGFGDRSYELPGSGRAYYRDRLDLRDSLGLFVDVTTTLDVQSRVVTLRLIAIDPLTGDRTTDPLGGFLPPNVEAPQGEGFFAYRISPLPTAPVGARIDAEARIVFDGNAPIDTPPIFNTLDSAAPQSRIASVTTLDSTSVEVRFSAADEGSGTTEFALYGRAIDRAAGAFAGSVAQAGAAFVPLATGVADSLLVFERPAGVEYEFFARAIDGAGNAEPIKTASEGATFVSIDDPAELPAEFALHAPYPNPAGERATLGFDLPQAGSVEVEVYDLLGRRVLRVDGGALPGGSHDVQLDLSRVASGVYLYALRVTVEGRTRHRATGQLVRIR